MIVTDHNGKEFNSIAEMCKYYGITIKTYEDRKKRGWKLERILTTKNAYECTDFLGNRFKNISDKCKYYGISRRLYSSRIEKGWSEEKALTYKKDEVVDHTGTHFDKVEDMVRHWNISKSLYYQRLGRGWTVKESLTGVRVNYEYYYIDRFGNKFKNVQDLVDYYQLSKPTFYRRLRETNCSIEKAIETISALKKIGKYTVLRQVSEADNTYLVEDKKIGRLYVFDFNFLFLLMREEL